MSKYTNYEEVSKSYDDGRIADGVETMSIMLSGMLKKDLSQIHMLEAGCGTGNYSLGFLENGVGKLTMLDASEGMLKKAEEKVHVYRHRIVEIKQHVLPTLPFPDETFDVVTLIQVIHHLDTHHLQENGMANRIDGQGDEKNFEYSNLSKTMEEAFRVLKPGGVLLIDHMFVENLDATWISLTPIALKLMKKAYMSEEMLIEKLHKLHFANISYIVRPNSCIVSQEIFENWEEILDPHWRRLDSIWQFPERTGELPSLLAKIQQKKDEGKLEEFAYEAMRKQRLVGSHNMLFGQKI